MIKPVQKKQSTHSFTDAEYKQFRQSLITQGLVTPDSDGLKEGDRPFMRSEAVLALRERLIKAKFITPKKKKVFLSS